jgi:transposase
MHIASIGIDLGKTNFHLVALGERNKVLARKKFSRAQLLAYTTNLPPTLIGLEACLGGHPNPANDGHLKTGQRELIPGR